MSKLKIDKGASRVRRVPLKTTIDGTVADDLAMMCEWSENDTSYVVNQLLRFALAQSGEFQEHKQAQIPKPKAIRHDAKPDVQSALPLTARAAEAGR